MHKDLISQLETIEKEARKLEMTPDEKEAWTRMITNSGLEMTSRMSNLPAFTASETEVRSLVINENGHTIEAIMSTLEKEVIQPGLNPASGGHMGYIPGGGLYMSALGDYMADITNKYAGIYFAAPGAVAMENMLIEWLVNVFGYPSDATGYLASGGSMANLSAIVTARDAMGINSTNITTHVIYGSAHMHHCLNKAIRIAGLSECPYRNIPLDTHHRMDTRALKSQMELDIHNGLQPFLLIGSAGTTDTGAIDPLHEMANLADDYQCWFHVDAAYGGFFILLPDQKEKFKGIERSHSLVTDPHKGMFLPYGTGVLLVRDGQALRNSHYYMANYMQDAHAHAEETSPADLSPELTKHWRGLRMWLPLMHHGLSPFRACLKEKLLLTQYFREKATLIPHLELGPAPDLSVTYYRYAGSPGSQCDADNLWLTEEIRKDGRVFVSSSKIDGKVCIRLAVLSFRTTQQTIDTLIDILTRKCAELDGMYQQTP